MLKSFKLNTENHRKIGERKDSRSNMAFKDYANCLPRLWGISYISNSKIPRDFLCHRATKIAKNFVLDVVIAK